MPDVELRYKSELAHKINILKKERNAVVLGHNYMEPALYHSIPDFTGDSLELCRQAAKTTADIIVFCGVRFMAETAKILNPEKTVLIPSPKAGCSLAQSITAADVRELKARFPGVPVVTYVNTYADVKAESDICCTSGNAAKVVESLSADRVIFLPDEFLAQNVARETGGRSSSRPGRPAPRRRSARRPRVPDDRLAGPLRGAREVHRARTSPTSAGSSPMSWCSRIPSAAPRSSRPPIFPGSTAAMIAYVEKTRAPRYLLLTECSMGDNIAAANPRKEMLRLCSVRCPHMNEITLEQTLAALEQTRYVVEVPEDIRLRALAAVQRMIEIG